MTIDNPYQAFLEELAGGEPTFSAYLRSLGIDESYMDTLAYADAHLLCIYNADVWGPNCPGCLDSACDAE